MAEEHISFSESIHKLGNWLMGNIKTVYVRVIGTSDGGTTYKDLKVKADGTLYTEDSSLADLLGALDSSKETNSDAASASINSLLRGILDFRAAALGLAFVGTVTGSGSTTGFAAESLTDYGDDLFNDRYYAIPIKAGGAAPEGEIKVVTGYTSTTGTFVTDTFTAALETDDVVLVLHESLAKLRFLFQTADASLENMADDSIIAQLMAIDGEVADFDDNLHSLEALYNYMSATIYDYLSATMYADIYTNGIATMPERDEETGNVVCSGAEQTILELTDTYPFVFYGGWIDFTGANAGAGEDTTVKVYGKIESGGAYRLLDEQTFLAAAVPDPILVQVPSSSITLLPFVNQYGVKVTVTQAAEGGGWNTLDYAFGKEVRS
jgi:hypothetical protein